VVLGLNAAWGVTFLLLRIHRDHVTVAMARLAAECEHTNKMREIAEMAAKAQAADPVRAAQILSQQGYFVLKPEELANATMRCGWVVLDPQRFAVLLECIAHRTNIDGRVDDMLRQAGFNITRQPDAK